MISRPFFYGDKQMAMQQPMPIPGDDGRRPMQAPANPPIPDPKKDKPPKKKEKQ